MSERPQNYNKVVDSWKDSKYGSIASSGSSWTLRVGEWG